MAALLLAFLDLLFRRSILHDAGMTLVQVDREHVDGIAVTAARETLGALVDCDTVDIRLFLTSAQLLDALAGLGVENTNQRALLRGSRQ